ncbi:hypothetical protein BGY98DRAFT_943344 [Russula aff. rugulosa BPL654]|nr:hypothetical protein BGY98DRAFT_943344 [Russula aff. rugulosa BPL654]
MASSPLEKRTTMVSAGRLPSSKLLEMSSSRPFVHQVDVIFPLDHELQQLQAAFGELETYYYTSRAPLAEIYESLRMYGRESESESGLSSDAHGGSVILSAGKETFEYLGLPGTKISAQMPGAPEQYLISVSLNTSSVNVRSNDFIVDSITRWDRTREESGQGQWDFAFQSLILKGTGPLSPSPNIRHLQNVHIPTFALPPRPRPTSNKRGKHRDLSHGEKITDPDDNDALEDWNERASSLFEWLGCDPCGPRLQANDRVDPYVAVYSPPAPFTVGDMVHMNGTLIWQRTLGLLSSVIAEGNLFEHPFIGLTIHGSTGVPILIPPRVPRLEGEDTACTDDPVTSSGEEMGVNGSWVMLESIGKWDSRFG